MDCRGRLHVDESPSGESTAAGGPPLRIHFVAIGTRGDVQPVLVAAQRLLRMAYARRMRIDATMITHEMFVPWIDAVAAKMAAQEFCRPYGSGDGQCDPSSGYKGPSLKGHPLDGNFDTLMEEAADAYISGRAEPSRTIGNPTFLGSWLDTLISACKGTDAIVGGTTSRFIGLAAAHILGGVPFGLLGTFPYHPSRFLRSVVNSEAQMLPGNRQWHLEEPDDALPETFRAFFLKRWRGEEPIVNERLVRAGLQPYDEMSVSASDRALPVFHMFSPLVQPRVCDWPEGVVVGGFVFPALQDLPALEPQIEDFVRTGPPPVYIGFGSMPVLAAQCLIPLIRSTIFHAPESMRFIVFVGGMDPHVTALDNTTAAKLATSLRAKDASTSDEAVSQDSLDPTLPLHEWQQIVASAIAGRADGRLLFIRSSPHLTLFPRCSALTIHCGAGTIGAALHSGRPIVPVPVAIDQPFWAHRVRSLGIAAEPILFKEAKGSALVEAIKQAMHPDIERRAAEFGERIRAERGEDAAAEWVLKLAATTRPQMEESKPAVAA